MAHGVISVSDEGTELLTGDDCIGAGVGNRVARGDAESCEDGVSCLVQL